MFRITDDVYGYRLIKKILFVINYNNNIVKYIVPNFIMIG